jgi:hypothetical protein
MFRGVRLPLDTKAELLPSRYLSNAMKKKRRTNGNNH